MSDLEVTMMKRIGELKAEVEFLRKQYSEAVGQFRPMRIENENLKAEVERLTAEVSYDKRVQLHVDKLAAEFTQSEVERLKAEVVRLTEERCFLNERLNHFVKETVKNREQVERLRKAGDAVAEQLIYEGYSNDEEPCKAWNAAKEGKQP